MVLPKHIHKVTKSLKGGVRATYYYAWRGGPRLFEEPGTDDFYIEYAKAVQDRRKPTNETIEALVAEYRSSNHFKNTLSDSTRRYRNIYLDEILTRFPAMPIDAMNEIAIKKHFVAWRDEHSETPKAADHRIETLRVLLAFGLECGRVTVNHARGISKIYSSNRAEVIWTDDEIDLVKKNATEACARVIDLARLTGLRKGDMIKLTWDCDLGDMLDVETSKTDKRVFIPILPELRALLDEWKKDNTETILVNTKGQPWKTTTLQNAFRRAKIKAGVDKRLHDIRGTFATMLIEKGIGDERTADILGWSKHRVSEIRRVYVDNHAIIKDVLRQLSVNEGVKSRNNY